jgi:hypothetical protein
VILAQIKERNNSVYLLQFQVLKEIAETNSKIGITKIRMLQNERPSEEQ